MVVENSKRIKKIVIMLVLIGVLVFGIIGEVYAAYSSISPTIEADVCFYDASKGELCLQRNNYEGNVQKIKEYFGFDENKWDKDESNESQTIYTYQSLSCKINSSSFLCVDNDLNFSVKVHDNGYIEIIDRQNKKKCDNGVGCEELPK